jgi:predicted enzyme related to lactoylglutathione lyase
MAEVSSYEPGTPSWVDLVTSDPAASRRFYSELFGWELQVSGAEFGHYAMCEIGGKPVAGIAGEVAPEGLPTAWTTYFATDDVDAAVERISGNGGKINMPPMDVGSEGRMAIAADPTGAVFGVWQGGNHIGALLRDLRHQGSRGRWRHADDRRLAGRGARCATRRARPST